MRSQFLFALVASIIFSPSDGSSVHAVGSFYTLSGPVILSLDRASGELSYNIYGPNGYSAMKTVTPVIPPRNDTAMAVTGYQVTQSIYVRHEFLAPLRLRLMIIVFDILPSSQQQYCAAGHQM